MLPNKNAAPTYEVCRRRLGICYVGAIVSICLICLLYSLPAKIFPNTNETTAAWFFNIVVCMLSFTAFSLPFDIAGFSIEKRFRNESKSLVKYLGELLKSASKFAILMIVSIFVFTCAAKTQIFLMVPTASLALCIFAAWKQAEIANFLSPMEFQELGATRESYLGVGAVAGTNVVVAANSDNGFTGGIVGLPPNEIVVVPATWFLELTAEELSTELKRRTLAIESGNRRLGLASAIIFVAAGLTISASLAQHLYALPLHSTAGIVTTAMLSTIWTFLGLLVLPGISQKSVNQIDWMTIESGTSIDILKQTIMTLSEKTENELDRTDSVQRIFHPVPTAARRLAQMDDSTGARLWNVSRYAVFISFAGLGLLGRAVHCNAGKPELWCILPAD